MNQQMKDALKAAKAVSYAARKILKLGNTTEARLAGRKWMRKQGK